MRGVLRPVVHHHDGNVVVAKFPGNNLPDTAKTADNIMIFYITNFPFQSPPAKNVSELSFHHHLGDGCYHIKHKTNAQKDQHDCEGPAGLGQRPDFPITHGGQGNDRHVEPFEETPALQEDIAEAADEEDGDQPHNPENNAFQGNHQIEL